MTLLKVHDIQQELALDFLKLVKRKVGSPKNLAAKRDLIYMKGQDMGFCNDEIDVLLEDFVQSA